MNILLTNDDGWGAAGLNTLLPHLTPFGHVTVVVPDGPRSGMSNAITAEAPITLHHLQHTDAVDVYTTSGTPSDCVKLALHVIWEDGSRPDLIVSGINHGSNAAINLIYSGTMGACFIAAEHNIPSIGFSIDDMSAQPDFSHMESYIEQMIRHLIDDGLLHTNRCYNINAPKGVIQGIKWTRQCRSHWTKEMNPITLDNGETAYRLGGYMVNDEPEATDTDRYALDNGYLSVQPCTIDMTDYAAL